MGATNADVLAVESMRAWLVLKGQLFRAAKMLTE
jgi:hypothetical protein